MTNLTFSDSVVIARSPEDLYDLISDVTQMGAWSPVCKACWWDDDAGPTVGAWFTGRNETPDRTWEIRCEIVVAEPGQEFAFLAGRAQARWGYRFTPVADGTEVTESWDILPSGVAFFDERFGEDAANQLADRFETARHGIPLTLAAIKATAEAT